jgi:hypothetical protein
MQVTCHVGAELLCTKIVLSTTLGCLPGYVLKRVLEPVKWPQKCSENLCITTLVQTFRLTGLNVKVNEAVFKGRMSIV